MAERVAASAFRSKFRTVTKDLLHWFPGHMDKGMKQMQHKLRAIDCVIEVHDARVPLSGRNTDFRYRILGVKPHILVLNKVDMIPKKKVPEIQERLKDDCPHLIFTNCKNPKCNGIKKLFPLAQDLISSSERFNRAAAEDYTIMIIGIPNVGKSSLINALRVKQLGKGGAAAVGAAPGITRSVMYRIKLSEKPLVYVLDTPGILSPSIPNMEAGMKTALCNTIQTHGVGDEVLADYLLFWLNKEGLFGYVNYFKLDAATDNILEVLAQISIKGNKVLKIRDTNNQYIIKPDFKWAAQHFITAFRDGDLGKILLDQDIL